MRVAIVGGGIAGLACAHGLQQRHDVTLYEASGRLGGRMHTIRKHGTSYEAGAGRFDPSAHTFLLRLLRELDLGNDMWVPLSPDQQYVKDGKVFEMDVQPSSVLEKVRPDANTTLQVSLKRAVSPSEADDVAYSLGYQSMFDTMNSKDALASFLTSKGSYYALKGGMETIVQRLVKKIDGRCRICLDKAVTDFDPDKNAITVEGARIRYDVVVLCVPASVVQRYPSLINRDSDLERTLGSLRGVPLLRVNARFPGETPWFHGKPKTTTNGAIKQFVPLGGGLAMMCYCDGTHAEGLKDATDAELMRHLRSTFPDEAVPEPTWIERIYWKDGFHCWLTNKKTYPNKNGKYYVCGEAFSEDHKGWIEGALRSASSVVKKINRQSSAAAAAAAAAAVVVKYTTSQQK